MLKSRHLLIICGVAVGICWAIPRLDVFVNFPIPVIQNDSLGYVNPMQQMYRGEWPDFGIRSPGYPLFLLACVWISKNMMTVVLVQCLLTLFGALFFLGCTYKTHPRLLPMVALVMGIHVSLPMMAGHDFILITESLFSSCILMAFGLLLIAMNRGRWYLYLGFSLLGGFAVLVRPSGIWMLACMLVVAVHAWMSRCSWRVMWSVIVPLPLVLLLFVVYNGVTTGFFGLSTIGPICSYGITSPYWEPSPDFPPEINAGIEQFKASISQEDRLTLLTSWDPEKLHGPFAETASRAIFRNTVMPIGPLIAVVHGNVVVNHSQIAQARKVAAQALSRHPAMYVKWVWSMFYTFVMDPHGWEWQTITYDNIERTWKQFYRLESIQELFWPWKNVRFPDCSAITYRGVGPDREVGLLPTALSRLNLRWANGLSRFFKSHLWVYLYFAVVGASLVVTVMSRFRHTLAVFVFAVTSMHLAAACVTALSTSTVDRYSSPTKFLVYLSVPFGILLAGRAVNHLRRPAGSSGA